MDRKAKWAARSLVAEHHLAPYRTKLCGRTRYKTHVNILSSNGYAWFDGVVQCRSRVCPPCLISRRAKLAGEIKYVGEQRQGETGCAPLLATMTIRHGAGDSVKICREVRKLFSRFTSGKAWDKFQTRSPFEWVSALEVTYGVNGYHPHIHLLAFPDQRDGADILERALWWNERWCRLVRKHMGEGHEPDPDFAFDLRPIKLNDYLTKLGLDPKSKQARNKTKAKVMELASFERSKGRTVTDAQRMALEMTDAGGVKGRSALALLEAGEVDTFMNLQTSLYRVRDLTFSGGLTELRKQVPKPTAEPLIELQLRGSEYGRLYDLGPNALISVLDAAAIGQARIEAERLLGRLAGVELEELQAAE